MQNNQPAGSRPTRHIAVKDAKEPWSEYILEDGTMVRVRLVMSSFRRVIGHFAPNGDPAYEWHIQPTIEVVAPDALRRGAPAVGQRQKLDG